MEASGIARLAAQLAGGQISIDHFLQELARPKTADLGDVQLDLDRSRRCGYPEVVFGQGKSVETIERVFRRLLADGYGALATRISPEQSAELSERFPDGRYNHVGRTFSIAPAAARLGDRPQQINVARSGDRPQLSPTDAGGGRVVVVTAGTTDLAVAEEAAETARWMGAEVRM